MSELSKYSRSKRLILEKIELLKAKLQRITSKADLLQLQHINQELEGLNKAVRLIDHRLSQMQSLKQNKAA